MDSLANKIMIKMETAVICTDSTLKKNFIEQARYM